MAEREGPPNAVVFRRAARWALGLGLLANLAGCMAAATTARIRRAQKALDQVAHDSADHRYERTLAGAYLEKAREEAAEAEYQTASELAQKAQRLAQKSRASAPSEKAGR